MQLHSSIRVGMFILLTAIPTLSYGQFQAPSKEELAMTSDPKAPGAAAVYLYREEKVDDPHAFNSVYARIKVLTEAGKQLATVHVTYPKRFVFNAKGDNSSRMGSGTANHWDLPDINLAGEDRPYGTDSFEVHTEVAAIEGRTIEPDGTIVPLTGSPASLLKTLRDGNRVIDSTFTMPDVRVGSIIEYRYQMRYDRYDMAPDWHVQQPYFTERAHFSFLPAEKFLPFRNRSGGGGVEDSALVDIHGETMTDIESAEVLPPGKAVKQEANGDYTLDLTDIPAFPHEAFGPPIGGAAYEVSFFYLATPDVKDYWQKEMGYWTKALNAYIEPTLLLKSTVAELVSSSATPLDKAKKLYEIVGKIENTDMSPDGDPGSGSEVFPRSRVETVLQEKKGTSNQIACLYLAMARIAGLNARPERIASRSHRNFSAAFRSTEQLDSILIALNIDGKEVIVDPGTKLAPFETLHWAHAAAGGVAMTANGKVETVMTPAQKNTDNTVLRVGSLNVSAQGAVSGTLKIAFIGQHAINLRQSALKSGPDAVKNEINQMLARQVPEGIQAEINHVAFLDDPSKQLLAVVNISGKLATHTGNRLVLPRVFFETRETNPFPAENARTLPVDMRYPAQEQEQITYDLPAGFTIEGKPEDTVLKWEENAAYELRSKQEPNSITTARVLARGFTLLDAKEYNPLRDFYQKVVTADQQQIVVNSAAQASNK